MVQVVLNVDFTGAKLKGTKIDSHTQIDNKWRTVWELVNQGGQNQDLRNADLTGAILSSADLSGADLTGANLTNTQLKNIKLNKYTKIEKKWLFAWKLTLNLLNTKIW